MRVYLDNCCYNRPFDDQNQLKVYLETMAKLRVQALMRDGTIEYVWSNAMRTRSDVELKSICFNALAKLVGHVDMERFIVMMSREPRDYTLWRQSQFCDGDETIEELGEKIMAYEPPWRREHSAASNEVIDKIQ